ncbi:MAG: dTDP-4-dehydrorhamnose 3,5-epimerase [Desulforhabdus sp.]|jgi:dTDP-4-dehydrorhamnose 3,5-epimerase|nr:dTDP-4-dehydrorhamnose 3,5-epimerase [Desulforhabdus sp.]
MKITPASIPDVLILEPRVYEDSRGFFFESYNVKTMAEMGISLPFVQDNHSRSCKNVLRGLHYQIVHSQGKLVRTIAGEVFDVAVDLRRESSTFGSWCGIRLSAANKLQLYIPPGFAHGFLVLSDWSEVLYKTTDFWAPEHERCILWNDEDLNITWPVSGEPILSAKDSAGVSFAEAELFTS